MPAPGKIWRHVIITTRNSWRPGDARGWRSRKHRQHSSGDYKDRPPVEEHQGLRQWVGARSGEPVVIPQTVRVTVASAIRDHLIDENWQALVIAVAGQHAHLLVELPNDIGAAKKIIGKCKSKSSRAIRQQLPGRVWADGGKFKIVQTREHQLATFHYIRDRQPVGTWVWTFRDDPDLQSGLVT